MKKHTRRFNRRLAIKIWKNKLMNTESKTVNELFTEAFRYCIQSCKGYLTDNDLIPLRWIR